MSTIDPSLFADVADALGISSPVIVEKDYYAVQLLGELSSLSLKGYDLVFAGGTCLAKAHQNTYRMSEDIDIKLIPSEKVLAQSQNKQRHFRRDVHQAILSSIDSSSRFKLVEPAKKRNEGKYQQFQVEYPRHYKAIESLRPNLQLDVTESFLLEPAIKKPIRSLYAEIAGLEYEVPGFLCATIGTTACEKFVSLLRRTAAYSRDGSKPDDETLIRHVYDLHLIADTLPDIKGLAELVRRVIENDAEQFGNQHGAFQEEPYQELRYGLQLLTKQAIHKERYEKFIGPLVYHPSPAGWDEAIETVLKMAEDWLMVN